MKRAGMLTIGAAALGIAMTALAGCAPTGGDPLGRWGDPDGTERGVPGLLIAEDGSATGTDGCNRLVGEWTATDTGVDFSPFASTLMYCEGVDTWLLGAASATVSGDTLNVYDESGAQIGTLPRTAAAE